MVRTLAEVYTNNGKLQHALGGTNLSLHGASIVRELLDLQKSEYGRGYLQAVTEILPLVVEIAPPEIAMQIVQRFEQVAKDHIANT